MQWTVDETKRALACNRVAFLFEVTQELVRGTLMEHLPLYSYLHAFDGKAVYGRYIDETQPSTQQGMLAPRRRHLKDLKLACSISGLVATKFLKHGMCMQPQV